MALGYEQRNVILIALGYSTYRGYLKSDLWYSIRSRVLVRDSHTCKVCGKGAKVVHHIDYTLEVLLGQADELLYSLCHKCHRRIEFDSTVDGRKLPLSTVVKKTKRLVRTEGAKAGGKPWIGLRHKARKLLRRKRYR